MEITVSAIDQFLVSRGIPYRIFGNTKLSICSYAQLNALQDATVTWAKKWNEQSIGQIRSAEVNSLIVVCQEEGFSELMLDTGFCFICTPDPKLVFFELLGNFFGDQSSLSKGIASSAAVYTKAIGADCSIGDHCVISKDTVIGNHVEIGNNVTTIGKVVIGDYCRILSGAVIGEAGFGYYKMSDGHHKQVPHLGGVTLMHHAEIGANTCIDRGTMGDTVIGAHSKIDNLVHIGHNVQIGEDVLITAGAVFCGSSQARNRVYIAPGAVIRNQIVVHEDTLVGMQALVTKDTEPGTTVMGIPAKPKK